MKLKILPTPLIDDIGSEVTVGEREPLISGSDFSSPSCLSLWRRDILGVHIINQNIFNDIYHFKIFMSKLAELNLNCLTKS